MCLTVATERGCRDKESHGLRPQYNCCMSFIQSMKVWLRIINVNFNFPCKLGPKVDLHYSDCSGGDPTMAAIVIDGHHCSSSSHELNASHPVVFDHSTHPASRRGLDCNGLLHWYLGR